ncbi:hypothetical protein HU200_021281 [Digitaria exilis]|uniref:Uncharacterized protein n=1 Tax=Digitaria exilis TaxID=1010633 RepID=A0A835KE85_9POAL|nr:hypothetical protein HU200_021281 [Digitaria exilis]
MSTMAWHPLPQSGSAPSSGDEFFETQSAEWLWSSSFSDDQNAAAVSSEMLGSGAARSEEQPVPQHTQTTDDIFMGQFSDEEMRRMDGPFEALDMFPDSMHRLQSYEDMLSSVLTGSSENQDTKLGRNWVHTMDTCGFPLFSHDVQNAEPNSAGMLADTLSKDEAGMGTVKRSRSSVDDKSSGCFEALVLEELEDVVFQLTKKTRICFRDALFRLAETSSKARGGGASGAAGSGCPERETNAIDRTVADMMGRPPCPASVQIHGSSCAGGPGAEAQSTTSWTARV